MTRSRYIASRPFWLTPLSPCKSLALLRYRHKLSKDEWHVGESIFITAQLEVENIVNPLHSNEARKKLGKRISNPTSYFLMSAVIFGTMVDDIICGNEDLNEWYTKVYLGSIAASSNNHHQGWERSMTPHDLCPTEAQTPPRRRFIC